MPTKYTPLHTRRTKGQLIRPQHVLRDGRYTARRLLNGDWMFVEQDELLELSPREVFIYVNDDAGQVFATLIHDKAQELWLESFDTEAEARAFCAKHQIYIFGTVNDVAGE